MKRLVLTITAKHMEQGEGPLSHAVAEFQGWLQNIGFIGQQVDTVFDAAVEDIPESPEPSSLYDPTGQTVAEIEEGASRLSVSDLREGLVTEALGKHRTGAMRALAETLRERLPDKTLFGEQDDPAE